MIDHDDDIPSSAAEDAALAELTEAITRRLESGEPVGCVDDFAPFPAWAAPVRRLLPLLSDLIDVGRLAAREQRGRTSGYRSRKKETPG